MDNKLSKPVMYVVRTLDGSVASVKSHSYTAPKGFTSEPLYSQEYVSALTQRIEELEAKLATSVRLPEPDENDYGYQSISYLQAIDAINDAGFTVEGDFCSACNERYCGNCAHANGAKVQ